MTDWSDRLLRVLEDVVGDGPAVLHEPVLGSAEKDRLLACVDSGFVSSAGPLIPEFEAGICDFTKSENAVAVSSGTAALHLALLASGVVPGDEVLMQSLTFVATANAALYIGATPHFVDVEQVTLGIDPVRLRQYLGATLESSPNGPRNKRTGARVGALVVMHTFGLMSQIDKLGAIADEFGIPLIEDAAEAIGSWRGNDHAGTIAPIGTLSFNGNKTITTGGGGAVLLRDDELAARVRHIATTAKVPHRWEFLHDEVAYNYRMPSLNAAVGLAQLSRLQGILRAKRELHASYAEAFSRWIPDALLEESDGTRSNYWLNSAVLRVSSNSEFEDVLARCHDRGFQARPVWKPLHELGHFVSAPKGPLPVTQALSRQIICLPSSPQLSPCLDGKQGT